MYGPIASYLATSCGLALLTSEVTTQSRQFTAISSSVFVVCLALTFFKPSVRFFMCNLFLSFLTLYRYLWGTNIVISFLLQLIKTHAYWILRYIVFYETVLKSINTLDEAKKRIPVYALVSNFSFIIESRNDLVMHYIVYKYEIAMCLFVIACTVGFTLTERCIVLKSPIYNDTVKTKRSIIQGSLIGLCTFCTYGTLSIVKQFATPYADYDYVMIACASFLLFANKMLMKHTHYKLYSQVCPLIFVAITSMLSFAKGLPDLVLKIAAVFISSLQLIIYDPIRYTLYVMQHSEVISIYQSIDSIFIATGIAVANVVPLEAMSYLCFSASCFWVSIAVYSAKYHRKDAFCQECLTLSTL